MHQMKRSWIVGAFLLFLILPAHGAPARPNSAAHVTTCYIDAEISLAYPGFESLSLDSLGHGHFRLISMNPPSRSTVPVTVIQHGSRVEYRFPGAQSSDLAEWSIEIETNEIILASHWSTNDPLEPLVLDANTSICHLTLLGLLETNGSVQLPAILHFPDQGSLRLTAEPTGAGPLGYWANRQRVKITFPAASAEHPEVTYHLKVVAIYPKIPDLADDPRYDGFRRDWLNIFQINPKWRLLSNNSGSDSCGFCYYEYADIAAHTPPLAPGLTACDLVRQTLDRIIAGAKACGMPGYSPMVIGREDRPECSADTYPSFLIAAEDYVEGTRDTGWLRTNYDHIKFWADQMLATDRNGNGLIKYILSGDSGSWPAKVKYRPANWWDTLGFGYEDAYANALAYRALLGMEMLAQQAGHPNDATRYRASADKLKSAYFATFYDPTTGVLAGWRSADGRLHDYYFLWVNGIAIDYGLVPQNKANSIMDRLLAKMNQVGYTNFGLGLPGNLIPVPKSDCVQYGPHDGFQIYENGGATACFSYFTLAAFYHLGRIQDGDRILFPLLRSFANGDFQGLGKDKKSKDWRMWDGTCKGYEGLLNDNYYALLAVLDRQAAIIRKEESSSSAMPLGRAIGVATPWIDARIARDYPGFEDLSVDGLGKKHFSLVSMKPPPQPWPPTQARCRGSWVEYRRPGVADTEQPRWKIKIQNNEILLDSHWSADDPPEALVFGVANRDGHPTLLGLMETNNLVDLPAILYFPGQGALEISTPRKRDTALGYASRRGMGGDVEIAFPAATRKNPEITYRLKVAAIYPNVSGIESDARFDSFRRGWLDILQMNPHQRMLANNASSSSCAFCFYEYADIAKSTPPLARTLTALDIVRNSLDRIIGGTTAYGMLGYSRDCLLASDTLPSLLIAGADYVDGSQDEGWLNAHYAHLKSWTDDMLATDTNHDGLIKYCLSGNSGSWPARLKYRPSNWWDTIGFGYEDAYANALAYRALLAMDKLARRTHHTTDAIRFAAAAEKLKAGYFKTFYDPRTGILAGWRSADGQLHDYYFPWVNGIAIHYGLVPPTEANAIMDRLLAKMEEVGYTNFSLGLPGNLIPVARKDYVDLHIRVGGGRKADNSDGFQIYENGGVTACFTYFTLAALYDLGRIQDGDRILFPLLNSYGHEDFQGWASNGRSRDWKKWDGTCEGYEGMLSDNYYAMLAVLDREAALKKRGRVAVSPRGTAKMTDDKPCEDAPREL